MTCDLGPFHLTDCHATLRVPTRANEKAMPRSSTYSHAATRQLVGVSIVLLTTTILLQLDHTTSIASRSSSHRGKTSKSSQDTLQANSNPKSKDAITHSGPARMAAPSEYKGESWMCRACVDVAQTWRETFPCTGSNEPMRQSRQVTDTQGCSFSSRCDMFSDDRASMCVDMKRAFREDRFQAQLIHKELSSKTSYYDICEKLSKCEPQTTEQGSQCSKVINEFDCADDPFCKERDKCDTKCHVCYWVVKTWPVFMEECYKGVFNGALPPKSSGVVQEKFLRRRLLDSQGQTSRQPKKKHGGLKPGAGSPPWEPAPENADSTATLQDYCFKLWDDVENSAKDRYLISVKSAMGTTNWHAQTVCQCMKICPYDELEAIDLLSYCSADELTNPVMLDAIKKSMFPDLDKRTSMPASIPRDPTKDAEEAEQTRNFWDHGW